MPSWGLRTVSKPIMLLGEAQGKNEASISRGFVGAAGVELLSQLRDAGLLDWTPADTDFLRAYWNSGDTSANRDPELVNAIWELHPEFYRTNVFQEHPFANDLASMCGTKQEGINGYPALLKSKHLLRAHAHHLERLADEIDTVDPNIIICLGNTALWAMAGTTGVGKLRGTTMLSTHTVSGYKLLPTYHPAGVLREWSNRPVTIADLMKAGREAAFPEVRRPKCEIWIEPAIEDMERFYEEFIRGCPLLSVDIETSGNQITCIGFAPSIGRAIVIPLFDERAAGRSYWPDIDSERAAWAFIRRICEDVSIPKLFQNGLYDIAFLLRSVGIGVRGAQEDTMLLSHALQPEMLKGLAYLGSVYTDHGPWKSERKGSETIKRDE